MLEVKRTVNLSGESKIDGVVAERYTALINESNPDNTSVTRREVNPDLYEANKAECREDQDAFDDTVDEIVKEMKGQEAKKEDLSDEEDDEH